jgi:hypothetical protein
MNGLNRVTLKIQQTLKVAIYASQNLLNYNDVDFSEDNEFQ